MNKSDFAEKSDLTLNLVPHLGSWRLPKSSWRLPQTQLHNVESQRRKLAAVKNLNLIWV